MRKTKLIKKIGSLLTAAVVAAGSIGVPVFAADTGVQQLAAANDNAVIAFPGAEGGGMYTSGARAALLSGENVEVYHVTNLNDSGEGSFRDAVSKGNRIVVFNVSGYIDLDSNVTIGHDNMTILGQTAPGDGVTFRTNNIKIGGNNVIVRYLRFRVGAHDANGKDTRAQDGLEITDNSQNVIIDHCSVSWGTDENLSAYAVKDVTIQNSIIAEALNQSVHDKGEHGYGGIWGGVNLSVHHNIIATHKSRNPKIGTSETVAMTAGYTDDQTLVDMKNNIIYNWGDKAGYGTENGAKTYIQNSIYKPGPSTPAGKRARIFELSVGQKYQTNMFGSVYANGNKIDVETNDSDYANAQLVNSSNWQDDKHIGVYTDTKFYEIGDKTNVKIDVPNADYQKYNEEYPITLDATEDVFDKVIANAGATLPKRDKVDERIIGDVVNRTAPSGSKGSIGLLDDPKDGIPAGRESEYDGRGYPIIESLSRGTDYDTDSDGIPDTWEDKMGLNKANPNDSTNIGPDGYTWLEIYVEEAVTKPQTSDVSVTVQPIDGVLKSGGGAELKANVVGEAESVEFYIKDTVVAAAAVQGGVAAANVSSLPSGDNLVVAKAIKADGSYTLSPAVQICVIGSQNADGWTAAEDASYDGSCYTIANGGALSKSVSGDFKFVVRIDEISNRISGVKTGIVGDGFKIGKTLSDGFSEQIYYELPTGGEQVWSGASADISKYTLFEVSRIGDSIKLYAGTSLADLESSLLGEATVSGAELSLGASVSGTAMTVSKFNMIKLVQSQSNPLAALSADLEQVKLTGDSVEVTVTPDNSPITEIWIYLNNYPMVSKKVNITAKETVSIPIEFTSPQRGTLTVYCFDDNLSRGSDSKAVAITQDPTPWNLTVIGGNDGAAPYVEVTDDYTFKISGVGGSIGSGTSDKYTYLNQKFSGDIRMYYRSRMQASKQFGVVFKPSLDSTDMYFFGGSADSDGKLSYQLIKRTAGGTAEVAADVTDKTGQSANLYFVAEKVGDTINIYQTENGSTIYTTKTLLVSIKCDNLGNEYYLGFGSVADADNTNVPDAGWVGLENIMAAEAGGTYIKSYENGVVTINKGEGFAGGKLVACGYNADGVLVDHKTADAVEETTSIGQVDGESYKIFLWNNLEEMIPICDAYDGTSVDVSGNLGSIGWNFDNGLDWLWQMQEKNVLRPSFKTNVSGNTSGMLAIEPTNDYSGDRYIFHEYLMEDKYVPRLSCDVLLTGDEPAMNVYFQTGSSDKAYKVTFADDGKIYSNGTAEMCAWSVADGWYNVNISTDLNESAETIAKLTIKKADGTVVVNNSPIEISSGAEFRTQINTAKKTPVVKAVYFEALSSASGKYYIDNVNIASAEPSVKVQKLTSWYTFKNISSISGAFEVEGTTTSNGDELSGEKISVAAGAELRTGNKSADGVSFTNRIRVNKNNRGTITVPVKNGSVVTVYGASANSSSARPLIINGETTDILAACATTYSYTGEDGTINVSAGDNIEVYGIKVESIINK